MALDIYKLTVEDYKVLRAGGTITKGDKTYSLDNDAVYVTTNIDGTVSDLQTSVSGLTAEIANTNISLDEERARASAAETKIEQLYDGQKTTIEGLDGRVTELTTVSSGIEARVSNAENDISKLTITTKGIESRVETAEGNSSKAVQTAQGLSAQVSTLSGTVNTVSMTANGTQAELENLKTNEIATLTATTSELSTNMSKLTTWKNNEAVDKSNVGTVVKENMGSFRGNVTSVEELDNIESPKVNDYANVIITDSYGNKKLQRYEYDGNQWNKIDGYVLADNSFTTAEWNAIRSGIDTSKSEKIGELTTEVSGITETVGLIQADVSKKVDTTYFNTEIGKYSTTEEMNSAISVKATEIESSVSATYETKADLAKDYYSKTQTDSQISQTANSITSEVSSKYFSKEDQAKADEEYKTLISQTDSKIENKVSKTEKSETTGFGWSLTENDWTLSAVVNEVDKPVFTVNKDGDVTIDGNVSISGYLKNGEAISESYLEYAIGTSNVVAPAGDDTWSKNVPEWTKDRYIWQRTVNILGTVKKISDPVCIQGKAGEDGKSINLKPNAESCTQIGDGYIDADGNLLMLAVVEPEKVFQNCGKIQGPQGEKGVKGDKGDTGNSAFAIDILNDYDSVPASYDGTIITGYNWEGQTSHTVKVYLGTSYVESFKVSRIVPTEGTDLVLVYSAKDVILHSNGSSSGTDSWTNYITDLNADKGVVEYSLYYGTTLVASAQFTAVKNKAGKQGDPAIDYWLTCTPNKIIKHKDGTLSSDSVVINFWSQTGTELAQAYESNYQYILNGTTYYSPTKLSSLTINLPAEGLTDNLVIKMLSNDLSVLYDIETISLIEDGLDGGSGEAASTISIQNDFDSIPCDKDGNVKTGYDFTTKTAHTIKVFSGTVEQVFKVSDTAPISGLGYTVVYSATDVTYVPGTLNTNVASYTGHISAINSNTGEIRYTLYKGTNEVANCKFEAAKLIAGDKGDDAIDYYIDCETAVVKKKADGSLHPSAITFAFKQQVGKADPTDLNCYYTYSCDGGQIVQGNGAQVTISTSEFTNNINIKMYKDASKTVKYDSESVFIVEDGLDGEPGTPGAPGINAYSLDIQNDFDSIPCANDGTISTYDWVKQTTHVVRAYCGMNQIAFKILDAAPSVDSADFSLVPRIDGVTLVYTTSSDPVDSCSAHISALNLNTGKVTYTLYYGKTEIANCKFEAVKQYAGANGKAATDYWIVSDSTVLQKNSTCSILPTQLNIKFMKQVAGEEPAQVEDNELYYEYTYNGGSFSGTTNEVNITTTAATTGVDIKLYNNATDKQLYDSETIPLVKDGLKGDPGEQGPAGKNGTDGKDGADGKSISVKASASDCTAIGDGYIDANGHLQILNDLEAKTFTDAGEIKGPKGDAGKNGADGKDGQSAVMLDILNDFDTVPCSHDGVIGEYDWIGQTTHTLTVYIGTLPVQFTMSDTIPTAGSDIVVYYAPSAVTFVAGDDFGVLSARHQARISNLTDKTGKIDYTVYVGNAAVATGKFEAVKQFAGKDGETVADYWLVPTANKLRLKKDNTITPTSITANFYTQLGTEAPTQFTGYYSYKFKGQPDSSTVYGNGQSVTIDTSTATSGLDIILWSDSEYSIKYDSESIPLITDGTDGKDGTTPIKGIDYFDGTDGVGAAKIEVANDFVSLACDSAGNILGTPWDKTTHTVSAFVGITPQKFTLKGSISGNKGYAVTASVDGAAIPIITAENVDHFTTNITSLSKNAGSIIYKLYYDELEIASAKFEAVKLLQGNDATAYAIVASTTTVTKHVNETFDPSFINFEFHSATGTAEYSPYNCYYTITTYKENDQITEIKDSGTSYLYSAFTSDTKSITAAMYTDPERTVLVDKETITIVKDGEKGDAGNDSIRLDIVNDFVSIPTDASGNIATDYAWAKTTHAVNAYSGTSTISYTFAEPSSDSNVYTMSLVPTNVTYTINNYEIQLATLTSDVGSIAYALYKGKKIVATCKFEAVKIKIGQKGDASTTYAIVADGTAIRKRIDGTCSPDSFTFRFVRCEGQQMPQQYSGYYRVTTTYDDGSTDVGSWLYGNSCTVDTSTATIIEKGLASINIVLYYDPQYTILLDTETIPAIEDGEKGDTGDPGAPGKGIAGVTNYYCSGTSSTVQPANIGDSSWKTQPKDIEHPLDNTYKYLWNYEVVTYSTGDPTTTPPTVIGTYGDTGRGIKNVTEYYLATSAVSGVTTSTSGWTTTVQTMTATNKYLWNYEQVTYTDDTKADPTTPCIIGSLGADGKAGKAVISVVTQYAISTSSTTAPKLDSAWEDAPQAYNAAKPYYWIRDLVTFDDDSTNTTEPVLNKGLNDSYTQIRGKNRTTYSSIEPQSPAYGDLWFDVSVVDGKTTNKLRQYSASGWQDVGGELVATQVTAEFIDALNITAQKITVVSPTDSSKILFEADGAAKNVKIGGFNVSSNSLMLNTTSIAADFGVKTNVKSYIGTNGWSLEYTNENKADIASVLTPGYNVVYGKANGKYKATVQRELGTEYYVSDTTFDGRTSLNLNECVGEIRTQTSNSINYLQVQGNDKLRLRAANEIDVSTSLIKIEKDTNVWGTTLPTTPTEEGQIFFLLT